jgi:hypothetical protein
MGRRLIDGLLVLWGIAACLLLVGGKQVFANPGDCDTDCRNISTAGSLQGGMTICKQFKHQDCGPCGNGCRNDLPALGGKCEAGTKKQEEATNFICAIECNNPKGSIYYQAITNETNFNFKETILVNWCTGKDEG